MTGETIVAAAVECVAFAVENKRKRTKFPGERMGSTFRADRIGRGCCCCFLLPWGVGRKKNHSGLVAVELVAAARCFCCCVGACTVVSRGSGGSQSDCDTAVVAMVRCASTMTRSTACCCWYWGTLRTCNQFPLEERQGLFGCGFDLVAVAVVDSGKNELWSGIVVRPSAC